MSEVRIQLGASRSAVVADHLWRRVAVATLVPPALLDTVPVADRYLVIVPPERVRLYHLALPPGPKRAALAALPFLLEDRLIEPLDHYEIIPVGDGTDSNRICLAVFERDWLGAARAALKPITRGEVRWVLDGWGWPEPDPLDVVWQIRVEAGRVLLHRSGPEILPLAPGHLEASLTLALQDEEALRPKAIQLDAGGDAVVLAAVEAWASGCGIVVRQVELPDAWQADYASCPWSLLRQHRSAIRAAAGQLRRFAPWRNVLFVAAGLAVIELVASFVYWGVLSAGTARAQREVTESFRAIAGPTATVVDPALQMRRLYQSRRHQAGMTTADDFLPLLAAVSGNLPMSVGRAKELGYETGRLRLVLPVADLPLGSAPVEMTRSLRAAGLQVTTQLSPDRRLLTVWVSR